MESTISKAQLSRELKISRARVTQMVSEGLPCRSDGRLNRTEAVAWIDAHIKREPRRGRNRALLKARIRRETAEAGLVELKLEREIKAAISSGLAADVAAELRLGEIDCFQQIPFQVVKALGHRFSWPDATAREVDRFVVGIVREQLRRIVRVREALEKFAGTSPVEEKPNG